MQVHARAKDDILKKRVLWDTVTWSKMGQQNIHAKKVYLCGLIFFDAI